MEAQASRITLSDTIHESVNHENKRAVYIYIYIVFKGLRLTAGRRPTWVCVGLGRVHVKLSGAYWALGGAKVRNWSASEMGALY